jgi:hypothetical protein
MKPSMVVPGGHLGRNVPTGVTAGEGVESYTNYEPGAEPGHCTIRWQAGSQCLQVASPRLVANAMRRDRSPKPISMAWACVEETWSAGLRTRLGG